MATSDKQPKTAHPEKKVNAGTEAQRSDRRQQLFAEQCAKRGVRFLPAQVMRPIYEREGLL
jgi:hypothetical protein